MKTLKTICMVSILVLAATAARAEVIPEMKECMNAHTTPAEYRSVLQKYCAPAMVKKAMSLLVIPAPYVVKTEIQGKTVCYTVRGTTAATAHEIPGASTQLYKVWWEGGRIIALRFLGPLKVTAHTDI